LSSANFGLARLLTCDFHAATMDFARLYRADLTRSQFDRASMQECDFREAKLTGASFTRAVLCGSRFGEADLSLADLRGANLRGARELTAAQLMAARTDDRTILPDGRRGPYLKGSGAESPRRR
jgi:serine/threonine-protein kinase